MGKAFSLICLVLAIHAGVGCESRPTTSQLLIENGTLIDGTGAPPKPGVDIFVRGGKIVEIDEDLKPRGSFQTIDATGKFIVPGLIDTHVHLDAPVVYQITERERVQIVEHTPRAFLYNGVTTVLDLSSYVSGESGEILARRSAQGAGRLLSPRIYAVGMAFTPTQGWGPEGDSVLTDPAEAHARARRYVSDGVNGFKVMVEDDVLRSGVHREKFEEMVGAVVEEARRADLPVYVHAVNLREYWRAIEMKPRAIVHGLEEAITDGDRLISEILQSGTYVGPTLSLFESFNRFEGSESWFEDPILRSSVPSFLLDKMRERKYILEERRLFLAHGNFPKTAPERNDAYAWVDRKLPVLKANVATMHRAGIKLAVGTDAGGRVGYNFQGYQTPREIELLVECGLTPMEALVAATRNGAEVIGADDRLGTIEPGKLADLLVLSEDPLQDIRHLRHIELIIQGGHVHERVEFSYRKDPR